MAVPFFRYLVKEHGNTGSVEDYLTENSLQPRDVFIVRQENPSGYKIFPSPEAFITYSTKKPITTQHYHEVLTDGPQKLRIDIDAAATDLARVVRLTSDDLYTPPHLKKHIRSENKVFQSVCEFIVSKMCDTFLYHFGVDPEICLCESIDADKKKYSRHLIIIGVAVSSSIQAREFCKEVVASLPESYRRFVDTGVYKRTQNFRLANSTKYGEDRVKKIKTAHTMLQTLLRAHTDDEILRDITVQVAPQRKHSTTFMDEVLKICDAKGLLASHRFRKERDGLLMFTRIAASHCDICKRVHDHDNTLLVSTRIIAGGIVEVYQMCRRRAGEYDKIGSFASGEVGDEDVDPATTRMLQAAKLQRAIEAAPDTLDDELFAGCEGIVYDEPALREFGPHDTIVVHAAMKMGKTKALREHITKYYTKSALRPPIIRFISFRQTFADNIKDNFPDFTLYRDVDASKPLSNPRLIIQVESLHRLEIDGEPPDLLILDESESIFEQFDSGLLRMFSVAISKFIYLLKHSKTVICMDANITSRTEHILREIRQRPIYYHRNTRKNATDDNIHITTNKYQWVAIIDQCVAEGEKCAIPMTSLEEASALHRLLESRHPTRSIMIYSSETPQHIKREHFADVNKHWQNYDVVIYTPTVSAGVSFEAKHFNKVFAYFTDNSCNDMTCIQMLGRIRDVSSRQTFICINARGGYELPTTLKDIRDQFYGRRQMLFVDAGFNGMYAEYDGNGEITYHTTPYFHIWLENTRARNLSRNEFATRLMTMLSGSGASVEPLSDDYFQGLTDIDVDTDEGREALLDIQEQYTGERKAVKYERNAAIAAADDIDYDAASQIAADMLHQKDVSSEHVQQYKKFNIRDTYRFYEKIDEKFVETYSDPLVRQQYKNLCAIGRGADADLERIRKREQAAYQAHMSGDSQHHDIHRKYLYNKHRIAIKLLRACGWEKFSAVLPWIHTDMLAIAIREDLIAFKTLIRSTAQEFDLSNIHATDDSEQLANLLISITSRVLKMMYGASIVSDVVDRNMKMLKQSKLFAYNANDLTRPVVHLEPEEIEEYNVV